MKKLIWLYGLILGTILCGNMLYMTTLCYNNPEFESNDLLGYAAMLVVFSLIFFGIRSYRKKQEEGPFSFGKAFKMGAYIALIGSTMYVLVWLFYYYLFIPDFLDKYGQHVIAQATRDGGDVAAKTAEVEQYRKLYQSPVMVVLLTYMEVLPIGLVVAAFSSLILRRKRNTAPPEA